MTNTWQQAASPGGLVRASEQTTVTLSSSADTIVDLDIQVTAGTATNTTMNPVAISGGFHALDPTTGNPLSFGAQVVRNAQHQSDFYKWQIRLVFGPQASAPSVLVKGYAIFMTLAGVI